MYTCVYIYIYIITYMCIYIYSIYIQVNRMRQVIPCAGNNY